MLRDANGEERKGIEVLDIKAIHDYAYMGQPHRMSLLSSPRSAG